MTRGLARRDSSHDTTEQNTKQHGHSPVNNHDDGQLGWRKGGAGRGRGRGYLAVVGAAVLGHGALAVHQEAVPPPLLRERCLVALGDAAVQLALFTADGLHILQREEMETGEIFGQAQKMGAPSSEL